MKTNCDSTTSNETSTKKQKGQKTKKPQETVTLFCAHFPERGALNALPSNLLLTAGIYL